MLIPCSGCYVSGKKLLLLRECIRGSRLTTSWIHFSLLWLRSWITRFSRSGLSVSSLRGVVVGLVHQSTKWTTYLSRPMLMGITGFWWYCLWRNGASWCLILWPTKLNMRRKNNAWYVIRSFFFLISIWSLVHFIYILLIVFLGWTVGEDASLSWPPTYCAEGGPSSPGLGCNAEAE